MAERVTIESLGAKGDGIAKTAQGPLFVPYVLPGEVVTVTREAARHHLDAIEIASPQRQAPFCELFTLCGGCATQHMHFELYRDWKQNLVLEALRRVGIETPVSAFHTAHGEGRRRVSLHARTRDGAVRVGYMAARSHDLVELSRCPVAVPALQTRAPQIALALAEILTAKEKPLEIQITATEAGLDVDLRGHGPVAPRDRLRLSDLAAKIDLARLSIHGEIVVEHRAPVVTVGRCSVVLPPGSFLQATVLGEATLGALVLQACEGRKRVADLFSGCGAFALRLAERMEVHAVESHRPALASLDKAARNVSGLKRVTTEARDLFRRPLLVPELNGFDAVVIDPPRAGAQMQAGYLAESSVALVVSVSCDVGTFARDAAVLKQGGYGLERLELVDQFAYTPHLEIFGVFRKEKAKRKRR